VWKSGETTAWLDRTRQLLENIFFVQQLTCPPGRGTEVSETWVRNPGTQHRNIFWMDNQLVLTSFYHKGSSWTLNDKVIPRPLPKEIGRILLLYLALVRPLEILFAEQAYSHQAAELYRTKLYVCRDVEWNSWYLSNVMKRKCGGLFTKPFGLRRWRQISAAIQHKHFEWEPDAFVDQKSSQVGDLMAAHSTTVSHSTYAVTHDSLSTMNGSQRGLFIFAGLQWHAFFGLCQPPLHHQCPFIPTTLPSFPPKNWTTPSFSVQPATHPTSATTTTPPALALPSSSSTPLSSDALHILTAQLAESMKPYQSHLISTEVKQAVASAVAPFLTQLGDMMQTMQRMMSMGGYGDSAPPSSSMYSGPLVENVSTSRVTGMLPTKFTNNERLTVLLFHTSPLSRCPKLLPG
jgi:hypothetical protein